MEMAEYRPVVIKAGSGDMLIPFYCGRWNIYDNKIFDDRIYKQKISYRNERKHVFQRTRQFFCIHQDTS